MPLQGGVAEPVLCRIIQVQLDGIIVGCRGKKLVLIEKKAYLFFGVPRKCLDILCMFHEHAQTLKV